MAKNAPQRFAHKNLGLNYGILYGILIYRIWYFKEV